MKIEVRKIDRDSQQAELIISKIEDDNQIVNQTNEVLTVTASIKPFISLVWAGVAVMVIGFFVSMIRRLKESMIIS
jgi:cytochrome c biogenesis factor